MPSEAVFIGRQPIVDRRGHLYAYELLFRSSADNHAQIANDAAATAALINHVFADLGLDAALGACKGFINVDAKLMMSDALELLPPARIVLELLGTDDLDRMVLARCRQLRALGFRIALDGVARLEDAQREVLDTIDVVKVDVLDFDAAALATIVAQFAGSGVTLLAKRVETREHARLCAELGFELLQGYHYAAPEVLSGRGLGHSEQALLRLLGLILQDADTEQLEKVFRQQPGLSLGLLRIANSVGAGTLRRIGSIGQAITLLGRRQLQRWLQLLLYADPAHGDALASPLLQHAAVRARMLELLAQAMPAPRVGAESAFLAGILSLMPALLGIDTATLVRQVQVDSLLAEALLEGTGPLGALLRLAEASEHGDFDAVARLLRELPSISHATLAASHTQALAWAGSLARSATTAPSEPRAVRAF